MTFSYNAGTTTSTYAGLVELNGLRFNDGTYKTQHLAGLIDTPPVRTAVSDLPSDHGAFIGPSFYAPRDIIIDGWIYTGDNPDDVIAAREYLKDAFAMADGSALWTLVANQRAGWATRRQCAVRLNGPISFEEPEIIAKKVARRDFTIPLVAPDPLLYDADNLRTFTFPMDNTHHTVTGLGTMPAPLKARFTGPWTTAASLIDNVSGVKITLTQNLAAGHYVDVDLTDTTNPTAIDDLGANMFGNLTDLLIRRVQPGANDWRAAGSSGTTGASQVTITYRDAWA